MYSAVPATRRPSCSDTLPDRRSCRISFISTADPGRSWEQVLWSRFPGEGWMSTRQGRRAAVLVGLVALLAAALLGRWWSGRTALGRALSAVRLRDAQGRTVPLRQFRGRRATVLVFTGIDCPVGNQYMPRLSELDRLYRTRGVVFLGLNANDHETAEQVAEHA